MVSVIFVVETELASVHKFVYGFEMADKPSKLKSADREFCGDFQLIFLFLYQGDKSAA